MSRPRHPNRSNLEIQPERCQVCGREVGGARIEEATAEGLRGFRVCDEGACGKMRHRLSFNDRRRISTPQEFVGESRIFPPGASGFLDADDEWDGTDVPDP